MHAIQLQLPSGYAPQQPLKSIHHNTRSISTVLPSVNLFERSPTIRPAR